MLPPSIRRRAPVPVAIVFEGFTQEQYEESVRKLVDKDALDSPADWPVAGLLAHIAGQGENGFRVVDVWESQEAFEQFGAHLMPVLSELGVEGRPEVYSTHTFVSA